MVLTLVYRSYVLTIHYRVSIIALLLCTGERDHAKRYIHQTAVSARVMKCGNVFNLNIQLLTSILQIS